MSPSKCSSRQSHSDYCSAASYSSDEESTSDLCHKVVLPAGVCPHCHRIFEQPVSLQCGHSLCLTCCNSLLSSSSSGSFRTSNRPRMGISSYMSSMKISSTPTITYRTPKCLVCGALPSPSPPIPNLELANFLRNIKSFRWNVEETVQHRQKRWDDEGFLIHECKIAVLGGPGVGKTCFARVQYGNEITFPDMSNENDDADSYMLDIVDGMDLGKSYISAHGLIVMYSIADRSSFYEAAEILKKLEQGREHNQPIVLVGSKKDKERRREISAFEGQKLAKSFGFPFLEVSAKKNDNVHETFTELVSMIQKQQHVFKSAMEQTLI